MSLITCGRIHQGHEWFRGDSRGRQDLYVYVYLYVYLYLIALMRFDMTFDVT